jgi:hypothetical protein
MRLLAFAVLLALIACIPGESERCNVTVTRDLSFTSPDAADTVTARSFGAACDRAIGFYAIHDAEGHPVWAWTTPLPRAFGDAFADDDAEHMREFLERWAQPTVTTTQSAPEWRALDAGQTTLDRLTYDDIRARNLPMLCHSSGTARELCVFWEPAAGGAGYFFDRTVAEAPS